MKGDGIQLYSYMEGSNNRYVIPVYQRRYDWKIENCKQLYNDLLRLTDDKEGNHFLEVLFLMLWELGLLLNTTLLMVNKDLQL